jgi:hypothetical protein
VSSIDPLVTVDTSVDDVLLSKLVEETPTEDEDADVRLEALPTPPATPGIGMSGCIIAIRYFFIGHLFLIIIDIFLYLCPSGWSIRKHMV